MAYELQIGVTGAEKAASQMGLFTQATEQQADRTKRLADILDGQLAKAISRVGEQQKSHAEKEAHIAALREEYARKRQAMWEREEAAWRRMQSIQDTAQRQNQKLADDAAKASERQAAAAEKLAAAQTHVVSGTQAASGALRAMEGAIPIRAAEQFMVKILGAGTALQAVFPLVGAFAFLGVMDKMVEKVEKWANAHNPVLDAQRTSLDLLKREGEEYDRLAKKLQSLNRDRYGRMFGTGARDRMEAGDFDRAARQEDQDRIGKLEGILGTLNRISKVERLGTGMTTLGQAPLSEADTHIAGRIQSVLGLKTEETNGLEQLLGRKGDRPSVAQAGAAAELAVGVREALERARLQQRTDVGDAADLRAKADKIDNKKSGSELASEQKALDSARRTALERTVEDPIAKAIIAGSYLIAQHPTLAAGFAEVATMDLRAAAKQAWKRDVQGTIADMELGGPGQIRQFHLSQHEQATSDAEDQRREQGYVNTWNSAEVGRVNTQAGMIRDTATRRSRLVSAGATPGNELSVLREQAAIQRDAAAQELKLMEAHSDILDVEKARLKYVQEIGDVDYDYSKKILDLKRQQKEEMASMAAGLVMSAQHGGAAGFVKSQLEGLESKVLTNVARAAIDSNTGKGITDKMHAGEGTFLGKMLAGTPFGADPAKAATVDNTLATVENTLALRAVAMSASGGGGSAGGGSGAGGALAALTGKGGSYSGLSGVLGGLSHTGDLQGIFTGVGAHETLSGAERVGAGIGTGAALVGGGLAAYSGFKRGGAQGALQGVGAVTAAAALLDPEPISKAILMGVAVGSGVLSAILGDSKAKRQNEISSALQHSQFMAPVSVNASMSVGGSHSDMDRFGNVRDSNYSPFPSVQQGYFDYRNNTTVAGRTLNQFGGPGSGPPIVVQINAMDSKSFIDHSAEISNAVAHALQTGRGIGLSEALSARH